ncbi:MAG: NADH-quinone oxidoreductase subunit C, partial [Actinobacteria bacterium]|nr:NADH-quinone oxidoreductase subunit C [Actinomycetota bacterium]
MSEKGMFGVTGSGDTSGFGGLVASPINIGSTQRPFGGYFDQVADDLERA